MYANYIEQQGGDENSIISAEHIEMCIRDRLYFTFSLYYQKYT